MEQRAAGQSPTQASCIEESSTLPTELSGRLGIEDLCSKREELNSQIKQEEEEKERLQHDIRVLSEKLSRVNESLAQRLAARATFDRTIAETEAAYTKILESSQSLLSVLKQEAGNLSKATEPRRKAQ
ncbi:microtubule nucleation factor SSNA1 isoform X1 [Etheostoma spectabile]|uniref:microtubule nucleation factor SSNA1 isoform X1 n=1 Tax=Etheostoma spectabile TaxID=54343 RepID=UPI0013AF39FE|nr:Sjoegren syndrome nuclear autoantigen 1 isoform X1 [Etheostoma spectabile]XP_032395715.1 Sjoegren syndrome nuclear autoantigen 1 isoform X1 [Etheostoma spectabile]